LQDANKVVGAKIKALRVKRGLTQDQLADLAGLNRTHLWRVETGLQSPTVNTLKIIADALEVRVRDLLLGV
jgi:transcriptional regulator with XRE-family HTH domain